MKYTFDVVVIRSGPKGLSETIIAKENGPGDVLFIEGDIYLGVILAQCIHNGYGLIGLRDQTPKTVHVQP